MARKKNAQPKRRLETNQGSCNKRTKLPTHYFPDRRTTNVVPADLNHPWLSSLPAFLKAFQQKLPQMREKYRQTLRNGKADDNGWYKGFRFITGNRIEIKVLSEWLMEDFVGIWHPVPLIQYAQAQAKKDERIVKNILENHGQVEFSEWSMIVSERCKAQTIHIDVPANNFQFGLVLQDGIPGTMVVGQHGGPETAEELLKTTWKDAPDSLNDCILNSVTIKNRMQQLLHAYGPLLMPRKELEASMVGGKKPLVPKVESSEQTQMDSGLKCGDLICTAGGVPHAGPAFQELRVVVFAAASPTKESLYNVDEQYYAHSSILFAIQLVWDGLSSENSLEGKKWLLRKLAKTVQEYETGPIENHNYVSKAFTTLMHKMAKIFQDQEEVMGAHRGETQNNESTQDDPGNDRIEETISEFLQEYATKSEESLFQYRPTKIWQAASNT